MFKKILIANRGEIACRIIHGASHWVAFEAPDEVNRLLIEFLGARGRRDEGGAFV